MTHLGLFEGIGGFSLAAKWMGWETKAWCEWNPFGQQVLKHYYPDAEAFGDITKSDFTKYANTIDILTGGFPCQPYSLAGKRKGNEDERHLWPEMLRAIKQIRPRWVVGENVGGLINWSNGLVFHEVQTNLEAEGYEVWPYVLPACAVNAPHRRDRVWFIAKNTNRNGRTGDKRQEKSSFGQFGNVGTGNNEQLPADNEKAGFITNADDTAASTFKRGDNYQQSPEAKERKHPQSGLNRSCNKGLNPNPTSTGLQRSKINGIFGSIGKNGVKQSAGLLPSNWDKFPTQSPLRGGDDGLSAKLFGITVSGHVEESIKAYGNAIVPQVAFQIFKSIQDYENLQKNKNGY